MQSITGRVIETHQACLLNLPDLIPDKPLSLHVATQLSQRVRRDRLALRRVQAVKVPGGLFQLRLKPRMPSQSTLLSFG